MTLGSRPSLVRRLRRTSVAGLAVAGLVLGVAATAGASAPVGTPYDAAAPGAARAACGTPRPGEARCFATYTLPGTDARAAATMGSTAPRAMSAADIQRAYSLPAGGGRGATVGIVDAYDNPNAESDLATYRARNNLPACTTANGCFRKVNQSGAASPLPAGDPGWGLEIALDLDAVSSACPACHILLVEADSPQLTDLGASELTAVRLGSTVVSNSFGADESPTSRADARTYFTHPGVPIFASTGDAGFEQVASFPAAAPSVIAVGGTTVRPAPATSRGFSETAWSGAGSGCSAYFRKPSWQKDKHCLYRTIADVSADADLESGLLVQDSYGFPGIIQVGGTSLSSPLVAAMAAMTDTRGVDDASYLYAHRSAFYDVTAGTNGSCGGDYLCRAKSGYDGPTGIGTPHGLAGLGPAR